MPIKHISRQPERGLQPKTVVTRRIEGSRSARSQIRQTKLILVDSLSAVVATSLSVSVDHIFLNPHIAILAMLSTTPVIMIAACAMVGLYRVGSIRPIPSSMTTSMFVARASAPVLVVSMGLGCVLNPRMGLVVFESCGLVVLAAALAVVLGRFYVPRVFKRIAGGAEKVLIIGSGETAEAISCRFAKRGANVVGMVDDHPYPGYSVIGDIKSISTLCRQHQITSIVIAHPRAPWLTVSETIQPMIGSVDVFLIPTLHELMSWRSGTMDFGGMPLVPIVGAQQSSSSRVAKRVVDVLGAIFALILTSPIMALAVGGLLCDSGGSVFFRQERIGRHGKSFRIWKFRTMIPSAEMCRSTFLETDESHHLFKLVDDPRVTRFGRLLRRFSIDELPQLLNVLAGEMSLVGPRPYPIDESAALQTGPAASRFEMLPGMTGLWQVSGRSDLTWDELCRLDAIYVRSWSFMWDMRILLQTPAAVLRGDGAY